MATDGELASRSTPPETSMSDGSPSNREDYTTEDGSPASHFFTTVISAAQNAASSLAGMKNQGGTGPGRSLSDSSLYRHEEEYEEKQEPSRVNDVVIEPIRSAISTLGKGELSLESLGITEENENEQEDESTHSGESQELSRNSSRRVSNRQQTEFSQGGTLAIPVMSRSKSRASSLISRHRTRKRAQSMNNSESLNDDSPPSDEGNGSTHQLTGFAYANKKRNRDFHRLFRSVTSDDYLLDDFSCALSKEILVHGRLYVSEKHVCFNSNILGWVTNLVIAFDEIVTLEKKNTAGLFPNGIIIQTLHARHSFASFVSRDSALEFLTSIWKQTSPHQARLDGRGDGVITGNNTSGLISSNHGSDSEGYNEEDEDDEEDEESDYDDSDEDVQNAIFEGGEYDYPESEGETLGSFGSSDDDLNSDVDADGKKGSDEPQNSQQAPREASPTEVDGTAANNVGDKEDQGAQAAGGSGNKWPVENLGPETHGATDLDHSGDAEGEKPLSSDVVAAPLGVIANLLFGDDTTWMKKFILDNQKNQSLSDLASFRPDASNKKVRNYEYIKPLSAPVGPKQTKCICTDTIEHWDMEDKVVVITTTQTPDVPSGNSFLTKTRLSLCWADNNQTKVVCSYWMEWSGKSWIKGAIERGSHDGQMTFATGLIQEINKSLGAMRKRGDSKSAGAAGAALSKKKSKRAKKKRGGKAGDEVGGGAASEAAPVPTTVQNGWLSTVINGINAVPVRQFPLPLSGWIILVLIGWIVFVPSRDRLPAQVPSSSLERDRQLDQLYLEEEYEVWKWIDDRVLGQGTHDEHQKDSTAVKYGKQELAESIRITEERIQLIKDRMG